MKRLWALFNYYVCEWVRWRLSISPSCPYAAPQTDWLLGAVGSKYSQPRCHVVMRHFRSCVQAEKAPDTQFNQLPSPPANNGQCRATAPTYRPRLQRPTAHDWLCIVNKYTRTHVKLSLGLTGKTHSSSNLMTTNLGQHLVACPETASSPTPRCCSHHMFTRHTAPYHASRALQYALPIHTADKAGLGKWCFDPGVATA